MSAAENAPENDDAVAVSDEGAVESGESESQDEAQPAEAMSLSVEISDAGPCRKHVTVKVSGSDIETIREMTLDEFSAQANVPGFRQGHIPRGLLKSKFKRELADELKQRVLVQSLEQLTAEHQIDPIDEPDMDVELLEIPEEGDFEYEFEVEVRPDVDLPDFASVTLKRPTREISDEDVKTYIDRMLLDYGEKAESEDGAKTGDYVSAAVSFSHGANTIREFSDLSVRVQPTLRFQDGEISGFDALMAGAKAGTTVEAELAISTEAESVAMRGETVKAAFKVSDVRAFKPATLDSELLDRIGVESEESLHSEVRNILERQVEYRQRQSAREQLLEQITDSSDWDLPEELVMKQVDNALHREILEMQQAGYTTPQIRARENELRQHSVSVTRQAMKEHFVLDSIATQENVEVTNQDIDMEITMMAFQSGETPRRLRARLMKTGVMENLEAQIRERKAVDIALDRASYEEVPMEEELIGDLSVEAVDEAICNAMLTRAADAPAEA